MTITITLIDDCRTLAAQSWDVLGPGPVRAARLIADALRRRLSRRVLLKRYKRFWAEGRKHQRRWWGEADRWFLAVRLREEVARIEADGP